MYKDNIKQIIADTSHEAILNADERYGVGQYEVLEARKIINSQYWGILKREKHEVTIKLKDSGNSMSSASPLKTEQRKLATPSLTVAISPQADRGIEIPIPDFITTEGLPELKAETEKVTYSFNELHKPRPVNGLRSLQEGTRQPLPQKLHENKPEDDNSSQMLAELIDRKNRTKVEINNTPMKATSPLASKKENNAIQDSNSNMVSIQCLRQMEGMLQNLQETIRQLNQSTNQMLTVDKLNLPTGLSGIKQSLLKMETPEDMIDKIITDISQAIPVEEQNNLFRSAKAYESWCNKKFKFSHEFNTKPHTGPQVIALVGPTGVGKTTTIAKLAAVHALNKKSRKNVAFFTLDTYRIGATDQLQYYAQHLGINLEIIYNCEDIEARLAEHQDKDLIMVDTAGRCQKDHKELQKLCAYLERMPHIIKYLVLSATTKYTDLLDTLEKFQVVGYDNLIFTKLDETNSFGPLLAIMANQEQPLAYITDGQEVPSCIRKANFDYFYHDLLCNSLLI